MIGSSSTTEPQGPPITTKAQQRATKSIADDSCLPGEHLSSSIDHVQGVKVGALAGGRSPLIRAFDGRAFAPLVEGCDELPTGSGRHHAPDVKGPPVRIPAQERPRVARTG